MLHYIIHQISHSQSTVGIDFQERRATQDLLKQHLSRIQNAPVKHQICSSYNHEIRASWAVQEPDNSLLTSVNTEIREEGT